MASRQSATILSDEQCLSKERLFCANCTHCKLVRVAAGNGCQYYLRVRCDAGRWRKKLGEEKVYKYFTVARRTVETRWETRIDVRPRISPARASAFCGSASSPGCSRPTTTSATWTPVSSR